MKSTKKDFNASADQKHDKGKVQMSQNTVKSSSTEMKRPDHLEPQAQPKEKKQEFEDHKHQVKTIITKTERVAPHKEPQAPPKDPKALQNPSLKSRVIKSAMSQKKTKTAFEQSKEIIQGTGQEMEEKAIVEDEKYERLHQSRVQSELRKIWDEIDSNTAKKRDGDEYHNEFEK